MKRLEMYKCSDCDFVVQVLVGCDCGDDCKLTCCGKTMEPLNAGTVDAAREKHVPVVEKVDGGYKVSVGSVAHPMEEDHWITFIDLVAGDKVYRQFLNPGDAPEAFFAVEEANVYALEYCNKHGLWRGE